jgi:NADH:ubiquinone oxidoreductase subunit 4 (subunit M)
LNLVAVAPLVALIVALGVYPNFVVHRTEKATSASIAEASPHHVVVSEIR